MLATKTKTDDINKDYVSLYQRIDQFASTEQSHDVAKSPDLTNTTSAIESTVLKKREHRVESSSLSSSLAEQKEKAKATVLRVEDISVLCEVKIAAGHIHIRLPKSLFPINIYYGMPISISYRKELSGTRRPVVSPREVDADELHADNEEMLNLINRF